MYHTRQNYILFLSHCIHRYFQFARRGIIYTQQHTDTLHKREPVTPGLAFLFYMLKKSTRDVNAKSTYHTVRQNRLSSDPPLHSTNFYCIPDCTVSPLKFHLLSRRARSPHARYRATGLAISVAHKVEAGPLRVAKNKTRAPCRHWPRSCGSEKTCARGKLLALACLLAEVSKSRI